MTPFCVLSKCSGGQAVTLSSRGCSTSGAATSALAYGQFSGSLILWRVLRLLRDELGCTLCSWPAVGSRSPWQRCCVAVGQGCLQGLGPGRKEAPGVAPTLAPPSQSEELAAGFLGITTLPGPVGLCSLGTAFYVLLYPEQLGLVSRAMGSGKAPDAGANLDGLPA